MKLKVSLTQLYKQPAERGRPLFTLNWVFTQKYYCTTQRILLYAPTGWHHYTRACHYRSRSRSMLLIYRKLSTVIIY